MKFISLLLFSVFYLICCFSVVESAASWSYSDQDAWKNNPEWNCDGIRQSPINIDISAVVTNDVLTDLKLWNFDQSYDGTLTNNGHTIVFEPAAGSPKAFFQNHLGTYELQQFHFHWGANNAEGSEHTIDGLPNSVELHFVTKKTTGIDTAGDAYAVLGVLIIGQGFTTVKKSWYTMMKKLPSEYEASNTVTGVRLDQLLPPDFTLGDYYHYEGSLTTPPCTEVVQWFVLREPVYLSDLFISKLRNAKQANGQALTKNFRYTQPIKGRNVMKKPSCQSDQQPSV